MPGTSEPLAGYLRARQGHEEGKRMSRDYGRFPFGRPNTERPMRPAGSSGGARAVVVGVYPSAWHVTWTAPAHLVAAGARGKVNALAVDVEPTVFWNGDGADFGTRLASWQHESGFVEGDHPGGHGRLSRTSPPTNGSSGLKVEQRYLAPLGIAPDETAFTDICPVFFVKHGSGERREQGDAIAAEFDGIARHLGHQPSSLPRRPSPAALVRMAVDEFKQRLIADLEAADAPVVITLGEEVLQALRRIPELGAAPPVETLTDLYVDRYGEEGTLKVNGRTVLWLPLAHPGLLRGKAPSEATEAALPRSTAGWNICHSRWESQVRSQS